MTAGALHDRLADLEEAVARAKTARAEAAEDRRARARVRVGVELTRPLRDYSDSVSFRKRESDEKEQRRLSRALLKEIEKEGLLLDADARGHIRVLDPKIENAEVETNRAVVAARQARDAFTAENADGLASEREAAKSARFKAAVAEGDLDAVREVLDARDAPPKNTLTTADLPG